MAEKKFKNFDEFLEFHGGDAEKAAKAAFRAVESREEDNAELREDKRQLKVKIKELSTSLEEAEEKIPAEGVETLTPEVKKELEGYRALGKLDVLQTELPDLRKKTLRSTFDTALTTGGVPQKNLTSAYMIAEAGKDVYFTTSEVDEDGKKVTKTVLNVAKLIKDHPTLKAIVDTEDGEEEGEEGNEEGEGTQKPTARAIIGAQGKPKSTKKADHSATAKKVMKGRYAGPIKRN